MDLRDRRLWIALLVLVAAGGLYFYFNAHGARETGEAINAVADELTGNRAIQQGKEIEGQIGEINRQRASQIEELEGMER